MAAYKKFGEDGLVRTNSMLCKYSASFKQKIVQEYAGLFYIFNEYKPAADEYFIFTKTVDGEDSPYYPLFEKDFAKQNFVSDIKSSSYLNGSFTYNQVKDYDDLWEPVEKKSGYGNDGRYGSGGSYGVHNGRMHEDSECCSI